MPDVWTLHETPHRHYRLNGKWSVGKTRIASVTQVLDNGMGALTSWAASQALAASEQVARDWLGAGPPLARSLLSFGDLAVLQPEWPDNVRDSKAESGTAAHAHLAARLCGENGGRYVGLPYGLQVAIDDWFHEWLPVPMVYPDSGLRVERIVGDRERAIAGTYDAQVYVEPQTTQEVFEAKFGTHRVDLKQSRTIQPKHFAQLAAYERCAILCGEEASDYLTILHVMPTGTYQTHSIATGSREARTALEVFDACLALHRGLPQLAKVLK